MQTTKKQATKINFALPNRLISDHMVLQQGVPNKIWGHADPGVLVKVIPSWLDDVYEANANTEGQWLQSLPAPPAGGPYEIRIIWGEIEMLIQDILCGEVWLASGQSNMEMPIVGEDFDFPIQDSQKHIAEANYPLIRMFTVEKTLSDVALDQVSGDWVLASPETVADFSAVGYFFAKQLYQSLGVPIGIINASWSATAIESWSGPVSNQRLGIAYPYGAPDDLEPASPSALYNGMIFPIHHYSIKGMIWYQGESNIAFASAYRQQLPAMIADWRALWGLGDIPFYFVQLPPFEHDLPEQMSQFREVQTQVFNAVPNTGLVVTTDLGQLDDIHPVNKAPVGERLAFWALARTYLDESVFYSGPHLNKAVSEGSSVRVTFEPWSLSGRLKFSGEPGLDFELMGQNGTWFSASVKIDRQTLLLRSEKVPAPTGARFSWADNAQPNFYNGAGLPAIPFNTKITR